jgi:dimethylamine/trimethylamine dehydrogenase
MSRSFPQLFAPIQLGPVGVRNRIFVTAHHPSLSVPDHSAPGFYGPSPDVLGYYLERAEGGVGLIIQGGTIVSRDSEYPGLWQMFSDRAIDDWSPIVEAVHATGASMFCQLLHAGHHGDKLGRHGGPVSSSSVPPIEGMGLGSVYVPLPVPVQPLTKDDIRRVVRAFGTSARNAARAGYRGIELHASHSYLVEQFYSPFYNKRTDEYGGTLENRMRFFLEVLDAIRDETEGALAIGARLICDEMLPGGLGLAEMREIAQRLDESGLADFIDLDLGTYHSFDVMIAPWELADHWQMEHIAEVAAVITNAARLGCPGRFHDPAAGEALIASGVLDMVGGTRGFFADPALARKAAEGRPEDIRPCIGVNLCATGRGACAVNPTFGRPDWVAPPGRSLTPKRVFVAGAGPAGLEAARVAAQCGHQVTVYESADSIGGALRLMTAIPGRAHMVAVIEWWERQLAALGVDVLLGTPLSAAMVAEARPDAVVCATGALFDRTGATAFASDPIPGWDQPHVHTPEEILAGSVRLHGRVLVLDEEAVSPGHGVAEVLALQGAQVQLVTRQIAIGAALGGFQQSHVHRRLGQFGITAMPNSYIYAIGDGMATLFDVHRGHRWSVDADAVVLVTGRTSRNELADELERSTDVPVHVVGDAKHPRNLAIATAEGHGAGRALLDLPASSTAAVAR